MGSPALYRNPERADLVFTKGSMGRQYLEQLDRQGGLADAAGGGAAQAGRSLVGGRADSDGWKDLHAGGYAFLSTLHTDENPTHIEPKWCCGSYYRTAVSYRICSWKGSGEPGGADNRPPERAGLQSVIDSERQPTGVDLGGAGDGEHGGADNRPPERAGL